MTLRPPALKALTYACLAAAACGELPLALRAQTRGQTGRTLWDQPVAKDFTEPAWWDQGVVFVGNWEPLDYILRRGGLGTELDQDVEDQYREEQTEATVQKLKAAGVNLIVTHFYKTGLESDAADIAVTRKFTALCHRNGIRVGAYIGARCFPKRCYARCRRQKPG